MSNDDETFDVFGSTDQSTSNLLEKGRYKFRVDDIAGFTSRNGNRCIKVTLDIDGRKIFDNLMAEGQMSWKWRQFLFAIGIREKGTHFTVAKGKIVDKTGLVDIGVKDRAMDDGSIIKENKTTAYSPAEAAIAPIKGVAPEDAEPTPPPPLATEEAPDDDL